MVSFDPPGVNGMTTVTVSSGKSCATAPSGRVAASAAASRVFISVILNFLPGFTFSTDAVAFPCERHSSAIRLRRCRPRGSADRSEEHTSELQSLMRISYAVFCLKKKKQCNTDAPARHVTRLHKSNEDQSACPSADLYNTCNTNTTNHTLI